MLREGLERPETEQRQSWKRPERDLRETWERRREMKIETLIEVCAKRTWRKSDSLSSDGAKNGANISTNSSTFPWGDKSLEERVWHMIKEDLHNQHRRLKRMVFIFGINDGRNQNKMLVFYARLGNLFLYVCNTTLQMISFISSKPQ